MCEQVVKVVESWAEANPGKAFAREALVTNPKGAGARENDNFDDGMRSACKFFINNGTCAKGDLCKYAHDRALRAEWIASRRANRRDIAASDFGDPHGDGVASKHARAVKFADWLCETYGSDFLNSGTGVLDVAGGRGDVSFELFTKRRIKSTLVEPRARKLNKHQHKWLKREAKKMKTLPPAETDTINGTRALTSPIDPALAMENRLCEQICAEFTKYNWHEFKDCSVIVGMHPDQATEAIVDFALEYNKPFAIVPCCVFPQLFQHRRDRKGKPVSQRKQLVEYLIDKTQGKLAYLDIEGANQVVFRGKQ
jgi:hypothetical protein